MAKIGYRRILNTCLVLAYLVRLQDLTLTLLGISLMASVLSTIQVVRSPYVSLLSAPDKSVIMQSKSPFSFS
ncbi:hypothetical protein AB2S62_00450 [Vibrio sp. NTOU-M3]|uniref:hypothetical protein n=1 Tax=Vibrio sp. NTOU-M3 TaxID=3234954 RepID=UPI00349F4C45